MFRCWYKICQQSENTFYVGMKMGLFLVALIFCGSLLGFSSQKKIEGLWPSLIEEMRLLEDKSSEYIDKEPRTIKRAKQNPSFSEENNSSANTLHVKSLTNASEYAESIATKIEKNLSISSSLEVDGDSNLRNDAAKFKVMSDSGERTTRSSQNLNWIIPSEISGKVDHKRKSQRNKSNFIELFNRSETFHSDGEKIAKIENGKDDENHLPRQTAEKLSLDNSSDKRSSTESQNVSFPVHPHPTPSSRLSKTVVAAIVAAINGIIGFTGAAIFTCKKNILLQSEERRPLFS